MAPSRSPARPTATRSSSPPTRSPRPTSTTSPWATGTRRRSARPATVTYAYAGAPEAVALDQDRAGKVLLVELQRRDRPRPSRSRSARSARPAFEQHRAGRERHDHASRRWSRRSRAKADPDLVLDVRIVGVRPDELDIDIDEVEAALARSLPQGPRPRRARCPALTEGTLPSPDTIAGAFIRDLEARIAALEADPAAAAPRTAPRRPNCATRFGSAGCCSPATRSRCEDPPAAASQNLRRYRDSTSTFARA